MGLFDGKVGFVTGGASGIGRATVARLRAEGADVVLADIDEAAGKTVAAELGAEFIRLDVSDADAWKRAIEEATRRCGGLDIVFLNAGISTYPARERAENGEAPGLFDLADLPDDAYRRILGVNVDGVVFGARAATPALVARGGGAIVATASVAGLIGFSPDPIYTATKHAVVGLVRALGPLLAPHNITVNAICPGIVDTNILGPEVASMLRENGLTVMDPSQIADAVVEAVTSGASGEAFVCLPNKDHERFRFNPVVGIGIDEADVIPTGDGA
jgi:NAD(P)-dependent dehydrogenase (short-subunit alcohol dehydrogenase family)